MKKLIRFLVFAALVMAFALPALAQTTPANTTATATQDDQEAKTNLYNKFRDNLKTNPPVAYEAGKEYLAKYEATDGPNDQYIAYIKKWVTSYDKLAGYNLIIQQLNEKKYTEAFPAAKRYLAENPNSLGLLFELSKAALPAVVATPALSADAADFTRRTLQKIQAGETFEPNKPIPNKEEIIGGLSYTLGFLLRESQPAEAIPFLLTAAQAPGVSQKDPYTYGFLAAAYETSEYAKLRSDYEANCKTDEQLKGAQCTELTAKVNNVVDRVIDAYARAVAYSKSSPQAAQFEQARTAWMGQLTELYKYRKGSDAGLNEYIAGVTATPLPRPGQATTPTTTPSSNATPQTQPGSTTTTQPANGSSTSSTQPKPNH